MPILTASGRISVKTLSICSFKKSPVIPQKIPWSPVVFWAVSAVIALMAYTPLAVMVFKISLDSGASAGITSSDR